jgi:hypothetical protein
LALAISSQGQAFESIQDGRSISRSSTARFYSRQKATPEKYKAGLDLAIERALLKVHESVTFVKLTEKVAALSA